MGGMNSEAKPSGDAKSPDYYQVWNQALFDLVPADRKRILEVGCASGRLGEAIKKRNGTVHYVGIELIPQAAAIAKERLDEVHVENVERFDWSRLAGKEFDCIIFGDVLEHLLDPKKVLSESARLLGRDGCIVCCLPNVSHWSIISGLIEGKWEYSDSGLLDRTHLRFFTIQSFRELLAECGFKVTQEERLRTGAPLTQEIVPFLRKLNVDVDAFVDRVTTFQFLFRAEPAARPIPAPLSDAAQPASWKPAAAHARESVAIIIPVFNKVELTRNCLASIQKHYSQDISPEVIVFDNASSDGTQAFLAEAQEKYDWLKVIRSSSNLGFAGACNKGAQLADADILVFLNNDTIVMPRWLEKMLDRINDDKVGMVGSKLIYPDGTIQHAGVVFDATASPSHIHLRADLADPAVNRLKVYPAVTAACIMIKRDLFMEVGQMELEYPLYYEDVDLCFKVRQKGYLLVYQPESVVIHLEGQSSPSDEAVRKHMASKAIFLRRWKEFMLREIAADPVFYASGREYRRP